MHYGQQPNTDIQEAHQISDIKNRCERYMQYHVIGQMKDGSQIEGIIIDINGDNVEMLVPEEVDEEQMNRQFGYGFGGYDDYGGYGGYGGYRRRHRRYRRNRFPFGLFSGLFRFPYYY